MKVTIGGDRLGSGNKNKIALHNYERSTHNLSQKFASSIAPGILYPFIKIPALRGDKFEIDLEAAVRTIPTEGPLFGSFKLQLDIFQCPIRLYQGILHNNPINIGLKMNQVKFPKIKLSSKTLIENSARDNTKAKMSNNCLLKYLGISGIGHKGVATPTDTDAENNTRKFNVIPMLAYYDIFKNYYANKQEENAYVITRDLQDITFNQSKAELVNVETNPYKYYQLTKTHDEYETEFKYYLGKDGFSGLTEQQKSVLYKIIISTEYIIPQLYFDESNIAVFANVGGEELNLKFHFNKKDNIIESEIFSFSDLVQKANSQEIDMEYLVITLQNYSAYENTIKLKEFALKNIDTMRNELLSHNQIGEEYIIGENENGDYLPYSCNFKQDTDGLMLNIQPLNGLVVKTYQADIYNTWVNTEWIDGENGIAELTKVSVSDNAFKIDDLNLAEKLYNVLNRIAISGNTYEDWQSAVYTEIARKHIESPIYCGGMSGEIVFEEIIQTTPTDEKPLGTLGGRGTLIAGKGGHMVVKCDEACYIIGILSLTPRIYYTQGNDWDMTELDSMDDFHKPALDGIGFQSLLGEQLAWWDANIKPDGTIQRSEVGKIPAWLNYMTAVDKAYGDFADTEGKGYMILQRDYTPNESYSQIEDVTTYIEPEKYNYAFAYKELDAQNFWCQVNTKIKARRLMSAKQIPNL